MKSTNFPLSVRLGALFYIVAPFQFIVAMIATASFYGPPGYNFLQTTISDLQATKCELFQGNQVCSPLHFVANASVNILGLLSILGTLMIRTTFPPGRRRNVALALLILAGIGAFANGFTPENVTVVGDDVTAFVAFLGANFALVQFGRLFSNDLYWGRLCLYSETLGIIGLGSLILYGLGITDQFGFGVSEWIIVTPILLWTFVVGIRLLIYNPAREELPLYRNRSD